jgi:hypothetical protein
VAEFLLHATNGYKNKPLFDMIPAIPKEIPQNPRYLISRTAQSTARAVNAMYVNEGF